MGCELFGLTTNSAAFSTKLRDSVSHDSQKITAIIYVNGIGWSLQWGGDVFLVKQKFSVCKFLGEVTKFGKAL